MNLEELEKELYKKQPNLPEQKPGIFRPEYENQEMPKPQKEWQPETPKKQFKLPKAKIKKYLFWSAIIIVIAAFITLAVWGSGAFRSFDKSKINLQIDAPKTVKSGERISVVINYYNDNKVALKDAKLYIEYPTDSLPLGEGFSQQTYFFAKTVDLGDIAPKGNGRLEFPAQVFGAIDEEKEIKARLTYMPENFTSQFENEYSKSFAIKSIPLSLDWYFIEESISGQEFEAKLSIINSSINDFHNLRVNVEYPSGFTFSSADPAPSEGQNTWDFEKITQRGEEEITIKGRITGLSREQKSFKARLGMVREKNGVQEFVLYEELKTPTTIVSSPLFISQEIRNLKNNTVSAGDFLNYIIKYKNTANVGIEKVEITSELSGSVLDFTTLNIDRGSFDSIRKIISWKGGQAQELNVLAPNESGELKFSIRLKDPLPIEKFSDKNFTVQNKATINSTRIPSSLAGVDIKGEDTLSLKVNSDITLRQKGFYYETPISNSGPIPPRVGQTTTYTIIWQISNTSNDIEDVVIESYLPAYMSWQGQIEPKGANIFYDNDTKKITWNLGKLPAQTGILLPIKQASFQIALTPSLNHLGKVLDIIGEANISGKDAFTNEMLQDFAPIVMTDLPDDPFIEANQERVTQ